MVDSLHLPFFISFIIKYSTENNEAIRTNRIEEMRVKVKIKEHFSASQGFCDNVFLEKLDHSCPPLTLVDST